MRPAARGACFGDGVVLDFRDRPAGYQITSQDVRDDLQRIGYALRPRDIVCIRTDADKRHRYLDFFGCFPGMSREAPRCLIDQGIQMMATDAWGWDRPYKYLERSYDAGRADALWPSHFPGREGEYLHAEKLSSLDRLPPTGLKIALFPIKGEKASGSWVRAVAFVLDEGRWATTITPSSRDGRWRR